MKKLSLSVFLLVLTISVSAFAAHHYKHNYHKWWENEEIVKEVGLTEKQVGEINTINESYGDQFKKLYSEVKALRSELYDLMGDPKATDEAITAKHKEKIAKKTEKMELKLEMKLKMRSLLNDEQIVKLSGIFKEKMAAYKEGKECSHKDKKEGCSYKDKK